MPYWVTPGHTQSRGQSPRWTDDGTTHDERGLKRRARKATRDIPIPPELVVLLRHHIKTAAPGPGGRVFSSATGLPVTSNDYTTVWKAVRETALTPQQTDSPYAAVPYSLRHAGVSFWLSSGVDPAEVARRAGHSIAVLYRFYAKILDGKREQANQKIEHALREAQETAERDPDRWALYPLGSTPGRDSRCRTSTGGSTHRPHADHDGSSAIPRNHHDPIDPAVPFSSTGLRRHAR